MKQITIIAMILIAIFSFIIGGVYTNNMESSRSENNDEIIKLEDTLMALHYAMTCADKLTKVSAPSEVDPIFAKDCEIAINMYEEALKDDGVLGKIIIKHNQMVEDGETR